ncbi:hypothetical protein I3760_03G042900 [Carya illinoinensis]|uniref:Uncharacterized protein n=1 Tax=Carya illinoinensis TaxID=32201 RepID=A0A922JWV9_CARIL|nr:hypothetical protein I3760_03G042900 [Carya illinoinensis]KAG6720144.1 hypothetical protein I3842_03G044800 [Carya illinoinensis]
MHLRKPSEKTFLCFPWTKQGTMHLSMHRPFLGSPWLNRSTHAHQCASNPSFCLNRREYIPTCMSSFIHLRANATHTVGNTGQVRGFSTTHNHGHRKPRSSSSIELNLPEQLRDLLWRTTREPSRVVVFQPTKITAHYFY